MIPDSTSALVPACRTAVPALCFRVMNVEYLKKKQTHSFYMENNVGTSTNYLEYGRDFFRQGIAVHQDN